MLESLKTSAWDIVAAQILSNTPYFLLALTNKRSPIDRQHNPDTKIQKMRPASTLRENKWREGRKGHGFATTTANEASCSKAGVEHAGSYSFGGKTTKLETQKQQKAFDSCGPSSHRRSWVHSPTASAAVALLTTASKTKSTSIVVQQGRSERVQRQWVDCDSVAVWDCCEPSR